MGVGRVIARPFVGAPGAFTRTANRRDFALTPFAPTLLDVLKEAGHPGGRDRQDRGSVRRPRHHRGRPHRSDDHGMDEIAGAMETTPRGLIFANLVDFDTRYGHRNDVAGYAANLERFDARLGAAAAERSQPDDLLIVTADHGNDPTTPSTDHSREHVPLLVTGRASGRRRPRHAPDVRRSRADLAELFGVGPLDARHELPRSDPGSLRHERDAIAEHVMNIREQLEQREREILAPQAAKSADTRGRLRPEAEDPIRPAFQRDRDRIIHCKAFRRLKHKTQVFFAPTGDHYRTRLTHTLEVSQIARSIAKVLRLNEELTEAIALGHDLGHTPFGHAGERVIERSDSRRLQSLRAEPAHRRRARERWRRA